MSDASGNKQESQKGEKETKRIPIREGFFHEAQSPSDTSYLIGSECKDCSRTFFPKRDVCPACLEEDTMKEKHLSRVGKIHSYSVLNIPLPGFPAPYIIGRTQLPEGPVITSLITGCRPEEGIIQIGDEAELVIGRITKDKEGNEIIGYMFRPLSCSEEDNQS